MESTADCHLAQTSMPKFVPVVDNEKSLVEQREDTAFDKHRRFDNPHKVDRGWQQGNVGWGVLGAFGSNSKDDAAQVIKRAEGSNKMIRNEKGLWVKAKELEEDHLHAKPGRGRGGGVSVYDELAGRSMGSSGNSHEITEKPHKNQFDDPDDYKGRRGGAKKGRDSPDRGSDRQGFDDRRRDDKRDDRQDDRRGDRYSDRRDDRRDESRGDRGGDRSDRNNRHRSRSPDRRRDSRRSPDRRRRDSRSRSRSGDRRRNDRDYNRSDKGRDSSRRRSRSRSGSRNKNKTSHGYPRENEDSGSKHPTSSSKKISLKDIELTAEELAEQAELMRSITAVQVINRFHEVFAHETLFPSERLNAIGQVFSPEAAIASLKSGVVHITGQMAVQESFAKTTATQPSISKRIYVEYSGEEGSAKDNTTSAGGDVEAGEVTYHSNAPKVTFCLDFHRPATAPGLGDRSKHTVLLYRCVNAAITHIWGMVDHEQLSQPEDLEKSNIMKSKVWACVKPIVMKDLLSFDESRDAHFHNYDRMEVWGMF